MLPAGCDAVLSRRTWEVPPIFGEIQRLGSIDDTEMARVFNLGIGMVAVVAAEDAAHAVDVLDDAYVVGDVVPGQGQVVMS